MLSEKLGKWFFWLFVIGFNLTFFLQHFLGMMGMARRVYTYAEIPYYTLLNFLSSSGAYLMAAAALVLLYNIYKTMKEAVMKNKDPWNAFTLEWYAASPPNEKNFVNVPVVGSRRAFYDIKHPDNPDVD